MDEMARPNQHPSRRTLAARIHCNGLAHMRVLCIGITQARRLVSFQDGEPGFTVLAFIVIGAIIYYFPQVDKNDWTLRLAMSMQLGGAVGNLIDRLTIGHVTDFISIGNFAVFNVADASISVGAAVLLLGVWMMERAEKKAKQDGRSKPDKRSNE